MMANGTPPLSRLEQLHEDAVEATKVLRDAQLLVNSRFEEFQEAALQYAEVRWGVKSGSEVLVHSRDLEGRSITRKAQVTKITFNFARIHPEYKPDLMVTFPDDPLDPDMVFLVRYGGWGPIGGEIAEDEGETL